MTYKKSQQHRCNFVCDRSDLSPPLSYVVVTVTTTFGDNVWEIITLCEILTCFATLDFLWIEKWISWSWVKISVSWRGCIQYNAWCHWQ